MKPWMEIGDGGTKEQWREAYENTHKWLLHTKAKLREAEEDEMALRKRIHDSLPRNTDHPARQALAYAGEALLRLFRRPERSGNVPADRTVDHA